MLRVEERADSPYHTRLYAPFTLDEGIDISNVLKEEQIESFYPEEYQELLQQIPPTVELQTSEQLRRSPKERIIAMDLADELRNIRELKRQGRDPHEYWDFFKSQAEYFGNETYGKLKVINYSHELAQEDGNLRLWIDALGKSARESYLEGYDLAEPGWYKERCRREADSVIQWERNLQEHLGHGLQVEISPAPFEVPKELLKGTNFGEHSFLRLHQLVQDEQGKPSVFSRAFRLYLPPAYLSRLYEELTGEYQQPEELLGRFAIASEELRFDDITHEDIPVQIHALIRQMESQVPDKEKIKPEGDEGYTSLQEMRDHYQTLEPFLRTIFNGMVQDRSSEENETQFMTRVLHDFQTWEKMLKGRVKGDWDSIEKTYQMGEANMMPAEVFNRIRGYYEAQEYKPAANSCGGGSGFSGGNTEFGTSLLSSTSSVLSGQASYEGLSSILAVSNEKAPGECVTCPYCGNKKNNKLIKEKYFCGNKRCKSNRKE